MERTPAEIGALLRRRREHLDKNQDQLEHVSAATVRKLEAGTEPTPRKQTQLRLARALRWPPDAYERLKRGDDPASLPHVADPVYDDITEPGLFTTIDKKLDRILELLGDKPGDKPEHHEHGEATPTEMPRPALGRSRQ